jgi:hypothetical protein
MFLFALLGFVLFFGGAWLRLIQVGAFKSSNPYAGPPPVLTCLFYGGFGIVLVPWQVYSRENAKDSSCDSQITVAIYNGIRYNLS